MEEAQSEKTGLGVSGQVKKMMQDIRANRQRHSEEQAELTKIKRDIASSVGPHFITDFAEFIQVEVNKNTGGNVNLRSARFALNFWQKADGGLNDTYQNTQQNSLSPSLFSTFIREVGVRDKYNKQVEQFTRVQLKSQVTLGKDDIIYDPDVIKIESYFLEGSLNTSKRTHSEFTFRPVGKEEERGENFVGIMNYNGGMEVYLQETS